MKVKSQVQQPKLKTKFSAEVLQQRRAIIKDLMQKNPGWGCRQIAASLGVNRDNIRKVYSNLRKEMPSSIQYQNQFVKPGGRPINTDPTPVQLNTLGFASTASLPKPLPLGEREQFVAKLDAIKDALKEQEDKTNYWKSEALKKDSEISQYLATWDHTPYAYKIPPSAANSKSVTVPVLMTSDWHVEEPVDSRTVLGANDYTLDIAHKSIMELTKTAMRLIELKRAGTTINQMVLWLGGDFITGHIHDENKSTCSLPPIEAILWAEDRIYSMIEHLLKQGNFEQIIIPCSCGNHARTTQRKHIAQQSETSFEWGMYNHLAREYKNNPRVKFVLNPGLFCIVELFNKYKLRFHHGDSIRFKDGVGGLTIPLNKRIAKWNENGREVYMDCMGHWHSYMPGRKAIVNGSLIGYNAFAQECGFAVEPPEQTLFFIEQKHGLTSIEPIFVRG